MTTLSEKAKILLVCDSAEDAEGLLSQAVGSHEVVVVQNPIKALALLNRDNFGGVFVSSKYMRETFEIGRLLQNEQILQGMPD